MSMLHADAAGKSRTSKPKKPRAPIEGVTCFKIREWCGRNGIGYPTHYYRLRKQGQTPREIIVGGTHLITQEDDFAWRQARRAEAIAAENTKA
jgi:hypothetical protein